jgi:hypothetical protein
MFFDFSDSANVGKEYNGFILLSVDDLPDTDEAENNLELLTEEELETIFNI